MMRFLFKLILSLLAGLILTKSRGNSSSSYSDVNDIQSEQTSRISQDDLDTLIESAEYIEETILKFAEEPCNATELLKEIKNVLRFTRESVELRYMLHESTASFLDRCRLDMEEQLRQAKKNIQKSDLEKLEAFFNREFIEKAIEDNGDNVDHFNRVEKDQKGEWSVDMSRSLGDFIEAKRKSKKPDSKLDLNDIVKAGMEFSSEIPASCSRFLDSFGTLVDDIRAVAFVARVHSSSDFSQDVQDDIFRYMVCKQCTKNSSDLLRSLSNNKEDPNGQESKKKSGLVKKIKQAGLKLWGVFRNGFIWFVVAIIGKVLTSKNLASRVKYRL